MPLVGLLGEGITRSLTPPMHREEGSRLGLDYEYRVIDVAERGGSVDDLDALWDEIRRDGYDACNVTHPFKQLVMRKLDELSPDAERLGAVNLVVFDEGRAIGFNTDWTGFRSSVATQLGDVSGTRVVQLGAGGAGAATAYALLDLRVAELVISDRDESRARDLVDRLQRLFPDALVSVAPSASSMAALSSADGVVHATPTGMALSPGIAFDVAGLAPGAWVAEVVYLPLHTELVRAARAHGHRVLDGGHMAVGQAIDSIRIITGREPDADRMRRHFLSLIGDEEPLSDA